VGCWHADKSMSWFIAHSYRELQAHFSCLIGGGVKSGGVSHGIERRERSKRRGRGFVEDQSTKIEGRETLKGGKVRRREGSL